MTIEFRRPLKIDANPQSLVPAERRLLAEGDSWFSLNDLPLPPKLRPNVLSALALQADAMIVNLARPGAHVENMAKRRQEDPHFTSLTAPHPHGRWWAAILLSGGGNDLIGALEVPPSEPDPARRLLRAPAEVDVTLGAVGHISEAGWLALAGFLYSAYCDLANLRDRGVSAGRPMLAHTYAIPTARLAGTLTSPKGWLYRHLVTYQVPEPLRQPLTELLFERLRQLLLSFDADAQTPRSIPGLHVFDSAALTEIVPAQPGSTGDSGDWINEIHLNGSGYKKMGAKMGPWVEGMLQRYGP
jgi:hypothetical protein